MADQIRADRLGNHQDSKNAAETWQNQCSNADPGHINTPIGPTSIEYEEREQGGKVVATYISTVTRDTNIKGRIDVVVRNIIPKDAVIHG